VHHGRTFSSDRRVVEDRHARHVRQQKATTVIPPTALATAPPTASGAVDVEVQGVDAHGYVAVAIAATHTALPEDEPIDFDHGIEVLRRAPAIEESEHPPVSSGPFGI
jgi:hypothetical protein